MPLRETFSLFSVFVTGKTAGIISDLVLRLIASRTSSEPIASCDRQTDRQRPQHTDRAALSYALQVRRAIKAQSTHTDRNITIGVNAAGVAGVATPHI